MGVTLPQSKNAWVYQNLEEARKDLPIEVFKRAWPWQYLDYILLPSSTVKAYMFCLMPLVCGTLLQWPMKRYGFDCLKWSTGIFFLFLFFKLWWHAHYLKFTALNILSIWFSGLMCIYLVELSLPLVSQTLSSCKTEIIHTLNYKASFLPTLSPW